MTQNSTDVKIDEKLKYIIIIHLSITLTYAILRHYVFSSLAYDLGIFSQALWTTIKEGLFFYETPDFIYSTTGSFFGVHFSPIMFLLVPIYAFFPSPLTLIIIQNILVEYSAISLYLLSYQITRNKKISLYTTLLFLIHPATIGCLFYDFHLEVFFPIFIFPALYYLEKRELKLFYIYLFLVLLVLDFASLLVVLTILLYAGFFGNIEIDFKSLKASLIDKRLSKTSALFLLLIFLPYSLITIFSISFLGKFPFSTSTNWRYLGSGITGILLGLLNPNKIIASILYDIHVKTLWLLFTLGTLFFIPLLAKREITLWFPPMFMFLVSTYLPYYQYGFQYGLIYFPLILYAYLKGIEKISHKVTEKRIVTDKKRRFLRKIRIGGTKIALVSVILILVLYPINIAFFARGTEYNYFGGRSFIEPPPIPNKHVNIIYKALKLIPKDAKVLAQMNIFPHLSHRVHAYVWLPEPELYSVEYAIADTKSHYYNVPPPGVEELYSETFEKLLNSGLYRVIFYEDGVIVIQKIFTK